MLLDHVIPREGVESNNAEDDVDRSTEQPVIPREGVESTIRAKLYHLPLKPRSRDPERGS
jgi:hypothetical protein